MQKDTQLRYWYINRRREQVFRPASLVLLTLIACVILVAIQPRSGSFREMLSSMQPDAVALNYARVLVALSPGDVELQTLLAQQYANLGRLAEADAVLRAISKQLNPTQQLQHLKILERRLFATRDPQQVEQLTGRVVAMLEGMAVAGLSEEQGMLLADIALAFGQPLIAAQVHGYLYTTTLNTDYALMAGRDFEAAERPDRAAAAYALIARLGGRGAAEATIAALRNYQAASDYAGGLALLGAIDVDSMSDAVQERAFRFARGADDVALAGRYARGFAHRNYPAATEMIDELLSAALASGDLETARHWALLNSERQPDSPRVRYRLAQVLEWRGETEAALEQWLWLARNDPARAQIERTWKLARGIFDVVAMTDLLEALSKQRALSNVEIDAWIEGMLAQQDAIATAEALAEYAQRHPADPYVLRAGANLLAENERTGEALAWWQKFADRFEMGNDDHRQMAMLHWQRFDLDAALAALLQVDPNAVAEDIEYWRSVGELAFRTNDHAQAVAAYARLAEIADLTANEYDILFAALPEKATEQRRHFANLAWQETGEMRFLLLALESEFEANRNRFERLLAVADSHQHKLADNPRYWTIRARHLARTGRLEQAQRSFEQALAIAPNHAPAVGAYAWFLVEGRRLNELWQLLDPRPELALTHPQLAAPFASGYMVLGRFEEAAFWYRKALDLDPDNLYVALEYAQALAQTGRVDEASHWRRKTLRDAFAKMPELDGVDVAAVRHMSRDSLSRPEFERLVHGLYKDQPERVVRALVHDQIAQKHFDGVRHWKAIAEAQSIPLDDFPDYILAHQSRDMFALAPYTEHPHPPTRAEAQLASRQETRALLTSLRNVNTRTPGQELDVHRRMAGDLSIVRPSGIRVASTQTTFGDVSKVENKIDYARPHDAFNLSTHSSQTSHRIDKTLAFTEHIEETDTRVRVGGQRESVSWEAEAGFVTSDVGDATPLAVTGKWQIDENRSAYARLSFDDPPDDTPLLRALGTKDRVEIGTNWQPTVRDTITAQVAFEQFSDRHRNKVADGFRFEAGWQHAVFFERPTVVARATLSSARRSRPSITEEFRRHLRADAFDDVLAERGDRIGFGLTAYHGEPGQMNYRVPSPRYRVDLDIGYQWPEQQLTYAVSAGVGTRVFGDDELALSVGYASRPDLGIENGGMTAALTYNYRLGR